MKNPFKIREDAIALGAEEYRKKYYPNDIILTPEAEAMADAIIEFQDISSNPHFDLSGTAQVYYDLMDDGFGHGTALTARARNE